MKTNLRHIALLLMLAAANTVQAQQKKPAAAQNPLVFTGDTVMLSRLAKDLGIDRKKAIQLYAALHYQPTAQLAAITGNPNIPVAEKMMMVKKVMMVRHRKIDSLLTPAQQALLLQKEAPAVQKEAAAMAAAKARHAQEEAQVPHQVIKQTTPIGPGVPVMQAIQVMPTKIDTQGERGQSHEYEL